MNVLVTGGAGYIGSHAVRRLLQGRHDVTVVDNLCRGHEQAVLKPARFEKLDIRDTDALIRVMKRDGTECVMHFAALAYVGESVEQPLTYYDNNTAGSASLLRAIDAAGVKRMVFSSTCATYGQPPPELIPIAETTPQKPINPYGWSKLFVERMLIDYANAPAPGSSACKDFAFAALRYFNVAGSAGDGSIGEDHDPETHIIPVLLNAALGKIPGATIFGTDYDTPDGTCIRDYVHVEDLVDAHVVVMEALNPGADDPRKRQRFYNLGTGNGLSVKTIVEAVKQVTGINFKVNIGPRRPGDPPTLYANPQKIQDELGWEARHKDAKTMVEHAWAWFQKHPDGY